LIYTERQVHGVSFLSQLITDESLLSPFLIQSQDIIDDLGVLESLLDGFSDEVGITTFFWSE